MPKKQIIVGLDPGGVGKFGWCVAGGIHNGKLRLLDTGVANHAAGAVAAATKGARNESRIAAVGIDSPLFWVADGDRQVEQIIRAAMKELAAKNVGGTVQ